MARKPSPNFLRFKAVSWLFAFALALAFAYTRTFAFATISFFWGGVAAHGDCEVCCGTAPY